MTAVEAAPGPLSFGQSSLVKMEERKRPISYDQNDPAPVSKRQATAPNGASKPHVDSDLPWKDDLEVSSIPFLDTGIAYRMRFQSLKIILTSRFISVFKKMPSSVKCKNTRGRKTHLKRN